MIDKIFNRKTFVGRFRIWRLRLYITYNLRMRVRNKRDAIYEDKDARDFYNGLKSRFYQEKGGGCQICDKKLKYCQAELHHILPLSRFRDVAECADNTMLLCHDCHRQIHNDPFINCSMITQKANELGIDLHKYYDIKE